MRVQVMKIAIAAFMALLSLSEAVQTRITGDPVNRTQETHANYYIEVSLSRCTLSLYEKREHDSLLLLKEYRVGTAAKGIPAFPLGKGKVTRIELNPWWHPTEYTREIYRQKGIALPKAVPPGDPLNYMGAFKIYLSHTTARGNIYRIHGTNNTKRLGRRVTGGCICMDNTEGLDLARTISVGTEVNIVL